jgi:predicted amidophosphoribosyltransferase
MTKSETCVLTHRLLPTTSLTWLSTMKELADRGYICPSCRAKYTMFDADRLFDPFRTGFFCEACGTEVVDNSQEEEDAESNGMCSRTLAKHENWFMCQKVEGRARGCSDLMLGLSG